MGFPKPVNEFDKLRHRLEKVSRVRFQEWVALDLFDQESMGGEGRVSGHETGPPEAEPLGQGDQP